MLSDQELMQIQTVAQAICRPVRITVYAAGTDDLFESTLANIAAQINGVSMDRIGLEEGIEPVFPGKPSLTLSVGQSGNIHYLAAPEGPEFRPFLDVLTWLGGAGEPPDVPDHERLDSLKANIRITVFVAATCTYCPEMVRVVLALAARQPLITVTIVDAVQFGDLAERFKVKSVPTTVINDSTIFIGRVGVAKLIDHLVGSQGPESLTATLESMIESGWAEDAAALLCRLKEPQAVLPLYVSKEFAKRIGALVTFEEALTIDPHILDPMVDDLTDLLFQEDVGLRGDTAELLGKIGHPAAIPALKKALNDTDRDVREAAEEALQELEKHGRS